VCDVRISSFIYVSLSFSQDKLEKDKGTLLAVNGTPPRRGIAIYSPIEGGFRGVCLSRFFFAFYPYLYFQDRPSCCFAAPDEDENTNPGIVSPFSKGG
jgi:hypothetical protein